MIFRVLLVLSMCRGGDRNYPGGKSTGPKPKMDAVSIVKRQKRQESKARTALRKATAEAAAVKNEETEQKKALLRKKHTDLPMCLRRNLGSERIADAKAAAASAALDAATAAAAEPKKGTLDTFFSKRPAPSHA